VNYGGLDLDRSLHDRSQEVDREGLPYGDATLLQYRDSGRVGTDALDDAGQHPAVDYSHWLAEFVTDLDTGASLIGLEREPLGTEEFVESRWGDRVPVDGGRLLGRPHACLDGLAASRESPTRKVVGVSLKEDDRALLQLVLGRGKSYSDIADLLGTGRSSVRDRAHGALASMESVDSTQVEPFADWLLGQSDDPGAAVAALEADPELRTLAVPIREQLVLLAPTAEIPPIPQSRESSPNSKQVQQSARTDLGSRLAKLDPGRKTVLAGLVLATALAAVVAVVLFVGSGNDGSDESQGEPAATTAVLRAVDGQEGEGKIDFGFSGVDFAANVRVTGLEPSTRGESYAIWLEGPIGAFPIQQSGVGESGEISGQISINQAIICFIAADFFTEASLSRTPNRALRGAIREARRASGGRGDFPSYTGKRVLEGRILMPADSKEQINRTCAGEGA
jgi:hypothetical protein